MATRRPLVNVNGTVSELPAGDVVLSARSLPFYIADGTSKPINLSGSATLPFYIASGASKPVPLNF